MADSDAIANVSHTRVVQGIAANANRIDIGVARGAVTEIAKQIDAEALEPNDAKVVVSKTNSLVVLGPSMCDAGVPCTNDDRVDLNYPTGFLYPIGVLRNHDVRARLAG